MNLKGFTHAIVFVGAPYGLDEGGHVISRHKSEEHARRAYSLRFKGTTGVLDNVILDLDQPYGRVGGETARAYFS